MPARVVARREAGAQAVAGIPGSVEPGSGHPVAKDQGNSFAGELTGGDLPVPIDGSEYGTVHNSCGAEPGFQRVDGAVNVRPNGIPTLRPTPSWSKLASRPALRHRHRTRCRPSEGARLRRAGVRRPRQRHPRRRRRSRSGVRCHRRRHREAVRRRDPGRRNTGDHRRPDRGAARRRPGDRLCSRVRSRPTG